MAEGPEGEAFVLWLDSDATAAAFRGRVEHVASSRRRAFATLEELADFVLGAAGEKHTEGARSWSRRGPTPSGRTQR